MHMWMQIVGKPRWALAPTQNHWWQVPLYVSSRGLTTTPIPYRARTFEVLFDFIDHRLVVETSAGARGEIALRARPNHEAVPGAISREEQPGALLLGCLRSRAHALQRAARSRAHRQRVVGAPRGEFARGDQRRVLARQRYRGGTRLLRLRAPRASGICLERDPAPGGLL